MTYDEYEGRPELQRQRWKYVLARNVVIAAVAFYMLVSMSFQTFNAIQGAKARGELLDCTQPTGDCFKAGQRRTGTAVNGIVAGTRATIIATEWCNARQDFDSINELERCVDARLKELVK